MHKVRLNWAALTLSITPMSPLLIKSGGLSPDPSLPDMQFVRTLKAPEGESVYIPGPSLKGVFRAHVEKVLRTVKGSPPEGACDPFADELACGKRLERSEIEDSAAIYKSSCRACKLFGNTKLRGRIAFFDAFPSGEVQTEVRHGVAISRLTQAVAVGPFDMEVAVAGSFQTRLFLENFEAWQLGLLALTVRDMNEGLVKIGFGKNRGFGEVSVKIEQIALGFAREIPPTEVHGIGMLVEETERHRYGVGLETPDWFALPAAIAAEEERFLGIRRVYPETAWTAFAQTALTHTKDVLS
jgi:CRISPR-associated protein Csm3